MALRYGFDVFTPTNQQGDDPWKPGMKNQVARQTFETYEQLFAYLDAMLLGNSQLKTRVVEVIDDDPTRSV